MIEYTKQYLIAPTLLVTPVAPDLQVGALVPGVPCPCDEIILAPQSIGRSIIVTKDRCGGIRSSSDVTIYYKRPNPYNPAILPDKYADWNEAWPVIVHTVEQTLEGAETSTVIFFNLSATNEETVIDPCGVLFTSKDEWVPGELTDNPGLAEYDVSRNYTDSPIEGDAEQVVMPDFQGEFLGAGQFASSAQSDDGKEILVSATEWRWVRSLEHWPSSREWPPGFVIRGTILWRDQIKKEPAGTVEFGPYQVERFELTEDEPRWEGITHVSMINGPPVKGEAVSMSPVIVPGSETLLPFN